MCKSCFNEFNTCSIYRTIQTVKRNLYLYHNAFLVAQYLWCAQLVSNINLLFLYRLHNETLNYSFANASSSTVYCENIMLNLYRIL